jgi:hypothetical protein
MISEIEALANAPPTTAPQDTPEECSSLPVSIRLSDVKVFSRRKRFGKSNCGHRDADTKPSYRVCSTTRDTPVKNCT